MKLLPLSIYIHVLCPNFRPKNNNNNNKLLYKGGMDLGTYNVFFMFHLLCAVGRKAEVADEPSSSERWQ